MKVFDRWYKIATVLVLYIYFKISVGFCVSDFCCQLNVVNMGGFESEIVRLSIVVNKEQYVCRSTFHLGYESCFKYLGHVKMIMLSNHRSLSQMSMVFPYALPCFKKRVVVLQLKWGDIVRSMNDTYLRSVLFAVFNCEKCHVYF